MLNTDWSGDNTHKMSAGSLEIVYKGSEHVKRQHAPSDHTACAGWADATNMLQKLFTTQSATVSHGRTRSLLQPFSSNSNRSIRVFLSQTFVASRSRSTLSVGSHATLRLVPIVLAIGSAGFSLSLAPKFLWSNASSKLLPGT